jgi:RNA polymerase sigma-70 factor (ECF subfamily)
MSAPTFSTSAMLHAPRRLSAARGRIMPLGASPMGPALSFQQVYSEHFRFVWRSLRALGVPESEVRDAVQDVFLAVHRKLGEFEGRSQLGSWLFGICLRVASNRRRKAHRQREVATEPELLDVVDAERDAATEAEHRLRLRVLEGILSELPEEQLAVFVLFELQDTRCEDIAVLLGIPLGTVYSRLRLARDNFKKILRRVQARERVPALGTEERA